MRIAIVGGGPAGLYFAILMKKRDPSSEVRLLERNPVGSTFGWGIVFSGQTLSNLAEQDPESHAAITERFELWENVVVAHRDQTIAIGGNRFAGMARLAMLEVLQTRCRELGVDLRFETSVTDPATYADWDLLVGADGVNSVVRATYADAFQPALDERPQRYIWLGTEQLFHGLTLTFRQTDAGVFTAHSYRYQPDRSTFIVECGADTLAQAGLDTMAEDACLAYLEDAFAPDLGGHRLLSNRSHWIRFTVVRNGRWWDGNKVLLGDALHTAHFSIGSGTKLALEDAIALAGCFDDAGDVPTALATFEARRRPVVERLQDAAHSSMIWFENVDRELLALDPYPLAYRLMTRSKRIDLDNLRKRDPAFVAAYEQAVQQA